MENINCKTILIKEINEFCIFLMNNCNDNDKKEFINEKLKDLSYGNILLFSNLLNKNNLDKAANYIITTYSVIDNDENKKKIIEINKKYTILSFNLFKIGKTL